MRRTHRPFPEELEHRLIEQFGPIVQREILEGFSAKRPTTFRVNTLKTTDQDVMSFFRERNIAYQRHQSLPHAMTFTRLSDKEALALPLTQEGKLYIQGFTSMIPPLLLNPQPGETVLDLCAAPGSKTSQMAAMMENRGSLIAIEKDAVRFQKLTHTLNLQGATAVTARQGDGTLLCREWPETVDRILADVPCSAEGRIDRSNPRSYGFWSEKNIVAHAKLQRSLLRAAVPTLKPGGVLAYSTCTLAPQENEQMIDWLLETFPELSLVPFTAPLPGITRPQGCYLLPSATHEGLFVSLLQKRA